MAGRLEQTRNGAGNAPCVRARPRSDPRWMVAARWTAIGVLLVATFWIYLGATELLDIGAQSLSHDWQGTESTGCTALTLDRERKRTIAEPCLGPGLPIRDTLTARLYTPLQP